MQRQGLVPCSNEQTDARGHGGNLDQARIRCPPSRAGPHPHAHRLEQLTAGMPPAAMMP